MFKKVSLTILVIIAVVIAYAAFGRKDLTLSKDYVNKKYSQPNSHFLNWKGTQVHYTESGKGFPILMIHGFGGSSYDFKALDSLLNDQYRVIRIDLPGFGLSDFPETKDLNGDYIKVYDEYFSFLLDTLHLDSMYVMGNSLGGLMSWNLAVKHPQNVKKLILFNSAGYEMKEVLKTANVKYFSGNMAKIFLKNGLPESFMTKGISRIFYDPDFLKEDERFRLFEMWNRKGNLQQIMNMTSSDKYLDTKVVSTIACPTLIVWGKYDKVVPVKYAEYFHRDIKNSEEIIYDSCGHVPMIERPLDVKRDVLKFLHESN